MLIRNWARFMLTTFLAEKRQFVDLGVSIVIDRPSQIEAVSALVHVWLSQKIILEAGESAAGRAFTCSRTPAAVGAKSRSRGRPSARDREWQGHGQVAVK
jgi:hypothetical protein